MSIESELEKVVRINSFYKMISSSDHPSQGQFVVTGPNLIGDYGRVGYCVQVRKGVGQFGSDAVLLRHADGALIVHENQCYYAMNAEQEALARTVFKALPEAEQYDLGYSDYAGVCKVGFLIKKPVPGLSHEPIVKAPVLGDVNT
ncbi:plasmid protein [Escherichia coli]|nr:plasmid protein [Escherichia coli]